MKKLAKFLLYFCGFIALLAFALFTKTQDFFDRENPFYETNMSNIRDFSAKKQTLKGSLRASWAKKNTTPPQKTAMAAYGFRTFDQVHDSLFANVIVLEMAGTKTAIISLDLLIFPPSISQKLPEYFKKNNIPIQNFYFSATHTHHGVGGWAEGAGGYFLAGKTEEELVINRIIKQIGEASLEAIKNLEQTNIAFSKISVPEFVENRVETNGKTANDLNFVVFKNSSGKKAIWTTYSAHANCISGKFCELSRDYAGYLTDSLQKNDFDFAMFSAGMVGSHSPLTKKPLDNYEKAEKIGKGLAQKIIENQNSLTFLSVNELNFSQIPIKMPNLSARITDNFKTRDFVFDFLLGKSPHFLTVLSLNNLIFLGTPCDFSGILYENIVIPKHKKLMITSFNGSYLGYITPNHYYDKFEHAETREMNWVGRQGDFFVEMINEIMKY